MDIVKKKLDKITTFWDHYVWNYKIIQEKILWNSDVKTNYYGDILAYFSDTFELLSTNIEQQKFTQNIFYVTGLMQIIYVHQDLTDELLRIFKQSSSSSSEKNPNRQIRNELIGHPISRKKDRSLKSSIFWGTELSEKTLHYIKYSRTNSFRGESVYYQIEDIIKRHHNFLNIQFDKILGKIKSILKYYLKKIDILETMLDKNIDFNKIVSFTYQIHEKFFEQNILFNRKDLSECKNREEQHERYKHIINIFLTELKLSIFQTKSDINEIISDVFVDSEQSQHPRKPYIEIVFTDARNVNTDLSKERNNYSYAFGKLHTRHDFFRIDYFKMEFKDDTLIMNELDNMERNYYNNLEYYSSYEYLRYLLKQRKLL